MAKATGRTGRKRVGTIPLTPGAGGVFTGETVQWGGEEKLVYRELKPEFMRSEQRIMFGENGEAMFHPAPAGATRIPMRHRVETVPEEVDGVENPDAYREYIIEDSGHGKGAKIFGFRPDPEQVERKAREAARATKHEELMDVLLDDDVDAKEVLQILKGRKAMQRAEGTAIQVPHKLHKGYGKWEVWDGAKKVAEKLSRSEADKRVEELTRLKQETVEAE